MIEATKSLPPAVAEAMQRQYKTEIAAFNFVADYLTNCETVSISN